MNSKDAVNVFFHTLTRGEDFIILVCKVEKEKPACDWKN